MTQHAKTDFTRTLDGYRARRGEFHLVDLPDLTYLAVDGHGDPNTEAFADAVQTIYPVAYALKFGSKALGHDYVVPPLEGLWWADDMDGFTVARDKSTWSWTVLNLIPEWLDATAVAAALERVAAKRRPTRLDDLRVETLREGRCVQTLHVGSFDDEAGVLAQLHDEFVPARGLRLTGRHHEIYLSDFRRVPPERRRTILRQPVTSRAAQPAPSGP